MDLRPRGRQPFSGFTKAEVEKLEQLLKETKEQSLEEEFCKKWSKQFNRSSGRAGKPILKWTEIQSWFQKNQQCSTVKETSFDGGEKSHVSPESIYQNKAKENPKMTEGKKGDGVSTLEFEARSSDDGAWYDVDTFLSHRSLDSGDIEVLVRYVGFGEEEDEWVNVKDSVRERSIPLEHSECQKVRVGDLVVCFQERQDQARYYDAHVLEVQRRLHDIRGCRCLYLIKYDHDNTEERVRLRRLCIRPNIVAQLEKH